MAGGVQEGNNKKDDTDGSACEGPSYGAKRDKEGLKAPR